MPTMRLITPSEFRLIWLVISLLFLVQHPERRIDRTISIARSGWNSDPEGMEADEGAVAVEAAEAVGRMMRAVEEIAAISDYCSAHRKQFASLARRIRLLLPMLEELKEKRDPIPEAAAETLAPIGDALDSAKELLKLGSEGSKIYLVLEKDSIMARLQEVSAQLEKALDAICFDELGISDEVREQVELVHAQFKRAKERVDMLDIELYNDLQCIYDKSLDADTDPTILKRLVEKLQLMTISDLKQESLALHEMVVASGGGDPGENIEKMSMLLKKIKDYVQTQNPEMGTLTNPKVPFDGKPKSAAIPDDFRCPISLLLMTDPVIVATGQTYERACIEKWLESGHDTCPKTQQKLSNTSLTPNYVLRSLIAQWCEANGMDPPKRPLQPSKASSTCCSTEHSNVNDLIRKLASSNLDEQRSAAGELRLLAKRNNHNRVCIAGAGAIPLLVNLLSTTDPRTQEHVVTALLNLSICEENKGSIVSSGAVPGIVYVLKNGSMESRENAAATLFSLSVVDENKVTIGASGAIPALVSLLNEGSPRGKKDAATALFNLCIYQGNKARAVRAGVVSTLMALLTEPGGMVDEALAILAILSSHPDGRAAIGEANAVPVLVEVIGSGSPRNKENAAAVLVHLCAGEQQLQHVAEAQECGVMVLLQELALNGTERGKRKATQLLERMHRFLEQQKHAEASAQAWVQAQDQVLIQAEESRLPTSVAFHDE